ncbi:MAG: hypothetical protein IJM27_01760 [Eubacterium sp.]|nr:hypothetical protein [Eubacterium sp.]
MPETKRVDKREKLLKDAAAKVAPGDARASVAALYEKIKALKTTRKKLTIEEATDLLKKYAISGVQLRKEYLRVKTQSPKKAGMYLRLLKKYSKDYAALNRYRRRLKEEKIKPARIDTFFEASRTRTVSLDGRSLFEQERTGADSNTRYKLTVPLRGESESELKPGDIIRGFFTEDVRYPSAKDAWDYLHQNELRITDNIGRKYPALKPLIEAGKKYNGKLFDLVNAVSTSDEAYTYRKDTELLFLQQGPEGYINGLIKRIEKNRIQVGENTQSILAVLKWIRDYDQLSPAEQRKSEREKAKLLQTRQEKKKELIYGLSEYLQEMLKADYSLDAKAGWGLDRHKATGQRNALMSSIAELLGCRDVLAFSERMNVRSFENGREVIRKGVFMLPAEGMDPVHTPLGGKLAAFDRTMTEDSPGLNKKIASLQLLDFICGNVDRHSANLFYQFNEETGKMTGIQGIDNDLAFGSLKDYENNGRSYFVRFRDMRVIPKSLADAVNELDPNMLAVVLQGYDLSEAEIETTLSRFKKLKIDLATSERIYKDAVPGYLDSTHPRIVPDEALDSYSLSEQLTAKPSDHVERKNLFAKVTELQDHQTSLATAVSDSISWMAKTELQYLKTFVDQGPDGLQGQLIQMKALSRSKGQKTRRMNLIDEHTAPASFEDVIEEMDRLLREPDIKERLLIPEGARIIHGRSRLELPLFKGMSDHRTEEQKLLNRITPLTEEQLNTDLPAYQRMTSALYAANEYLQDNAETAMQYQELQADLKATRGKAHAEAVKSMNTLKSTAAFKKYMLVLSVRDRLTEQLDRFTSLQKESYELLQTPLLYHRITRAQNDPYAGSKLQEAGRKKASEAISNQRKLMDQRRGPVLGM